jgi:hypothetical protein
VKYQVVIVAAAAAGCSVFQDFTGYSSGSSPAPADAGPSADASTEDEVPGTRQNDGGSPDPADAQVPCVPKSIGPRYGLIAEDVPPATWSNRNGALVPNDGQYAHTDYKSGTLEISDFRFALPAGASVRGIVVEIARIAEGSITDTVALVKGHSKAGGAWPQGPEVGPYRTATYGSSTDTWGATWTSADINTSTFSVRIMAMGSGDGHVDSVGVTVYYCD